MKTLSLYIDRWYIAAAVCYDNIPRRIDLPNREDRIWLYFYEDIKNRVDDFHIDVSGAFLKEADKIYSKLAIKYSGTELVLRFKQKLFTKGYDADLINNYINEKS